MFRRVVVGIIWWVVIYVITLIVGGIIAGKVAPQATPEQTASVLNEYQMVFIIASLIPAVLGTYLGVLPGTKIIPDETDGSSKSTSDEN